MLDLIIFSKDRACQLDLLLRSIKSEVAEWREIRIAVLYTYSGWPLGHAYDLVRAQHPEIEFVCERDLDVPFKQATVNLLGSRPLVAFLVDDDVFKQPFTLNASEVQAFQADPDIMCVSLRMDPLMDYVYTEDRPAVIPTFGPGNIWDWTVCDGDWGYPMSLDGHIFRTPEFLPLISRIEFHNPNSLEFELAKQPLPNPRAVCFDVARIINLPMNRVQDTAPNRHAGEDARHFNTRFLRGERLALATVAGVRPRSPHQPVPLKWESWQGAPRWIGIVAEAETQAAALTRRLARIRRLARRAVTIVRRLPGSASRRA